MEDNAIVMINSSGFIMSSENTKSILGFESSEVNGKKFCDLLLTPYKEHYTALISAFWNSLGHTEDILFESAVIYLKHKTSGSARIRLAISKMKQSEEIILMASIEEHKESTSATIGINDNGFILSCSQTESVFGYSHYALIHKPLSRILPYYNQHQETSSGTNKTMNLIGKHQNGNLFWLSLQKRVVKVGTFELTTLQLQKVDSSTEALFITDHNGNILSCDPVSILHLFGYRSQDVMGCNLTSFITKKKKLLFQTPTTQNHANLSKEEEKEEGDNGQSSTKSNKRQKINADSSPSNEQSTECTWETIRTHFMHKDGSLVSTRLQVFPFYKEGNKGETFFSVRMKQIGLESATQERVGEYILLEMVGRGHLGKVKRAIHERTGQQVAIKIINKRSLSLADMERSQRETQIMKKLNHQNIVKLYNVIDTPEKSYLVMEYIQGINLLKYLVEKNSMTEVEVKEIFVQLISALNYCQSVVHKDVKLKNILIERETMMVKLIDFGLSNWSNEGFAD